MIPTEPELNIWSIIWVDDVFGEVLDHINSVKEEVYFKSTCKIFDEGRQILLRSILAYRIFDTFFRYDVFSMSFRDPGDIEKVSGTSGSCPNYLADGPASSEVYEDSIGLKEQEKAFRSREDVCIKYETFSNTSTLISVCLDLKTIVQNIEQTDYYTMVQHMLVKRLFLESLCIIK